MTTNDGKAPAGSAFARYTLEKLRTLKAGDSLPEWLRPSYVLMHSDGTCCSKKNCLRRHQKVEFEISIGDSGQ